MILNAKIHLSSLCSVQGACTTRWIIMAGWHEECDVVYLSVFPSVFFVSVPCLLLWLFNAKILHIILGNYHVLALGPTRSDSYRKKLSCFSFFSQSFSQQLLFNSSHYRPFSRLWTIRKNPGIMNFEKGLIMTTWCDTKFLESLCHSLSFLGIRSLPSATFDRQRLLVNSC